MNSEVLRETAALEYNAASSGEQLSYNFEYLFMENCIQAGYTMDEAVDAALQKFKLYMSQEAKLCSRIGKEIKANVKKKNYSEAIALAKKRLAHLENLLRRADEEIDDDEEFIISMEAMAKSVIITMIVSAILVKVAEGIVPGSGWLIDAIKKGISKLKIKLGKDGSFIRDIVDPILTIAGISKQVSKPIVSHKMKRWQKDRNGDINREYNEGRPDMTTMSISRTQAKTRFKKLIQAQKDEIRMLEEAQKLHNKPKPKNESVELDEGVFNLFGKKKKSAPAPKRMNKEDATHAEFMKWYNSLHDKNKEAFYNEMMKIAARLVKQQLAENKRGGTGFSVHELDDDLKEEPKTMKYIYVFEYNIYDFFNNANINYRDNVQTNDFWKAQSELVKKFKKAGIELDCGGDWDDGPFYIISVSDAIKRKFTPKAQTTNENVDIIVEASILLNSGFRGTREEVLQEAKLKTSARNVLPDSDFGLPEDRKFPLNDAAHVKAAIKMFSHCPDEKKAKLAKRIVAAMGKYGVNTKFSEESPMYNYVSAKYKAD